MSLPTKFRCCAPSNRGHGRQKKRGREAESLRTGDRVLIREKHHILYDTDAKDVIRLVQIAGTLEFVRDRDTRLEAGLITITADEKVSEEGFDCEAHVKPCTPTGRGRR